MKRKKIEKLIKIENLRRKQRLAKHRKKYIKILYYTIILFVLGFIDDINNIFVGFNYKTEWEQQNKQLDKQKLRINNLESDITKMTDIIESKDKEIEKLKANIGEKDTIIKNLRKRIKELKK